MASNGNTTYARDTSSTEWFGRSIMALTNELDICKFRFAARLLDMQRELAKEVRDETVIGEIAQDIVDAECALSRAREDLADAEEGA